jgi:hypothetical protein
MPEPGWIPKHTQPPESRECMRLAVSCASGIHWRRLRFFDPADHNVNWWREWDTLLTERGYRIDRMTREQAEASGEFWLATVDSFVYPKPITHVVVMKGKRLHYDSAQIKRQRAPRVLRANPMLIRKIGG